MFNRSTLALILLGFLTACDSDVANFPDAGGTPDAAPDGGPPQDGAAPMDGDVGDAATPDASPEPMAITDRASRGTHSCRVVRDRTDHSPRMWGHSASALVTTSGGAAYLARREGMGAGFGQLTGAQFLVSTLDTAGSFGTPTTVPSVPADVGDVAAAPRGDGFALVWVEGTRLRFAAFDAAGMITIAPKDVVGGVKETVTPRMAAGPDGGFGVVYDPEGANGARSVQFLVLAADGTVRAQPRRLDGPATGMNYTPTAPAISGGPSGYAMLWADPAAPDGAIDFARADAAGVETVARRRIASPGEGNETGRVGWLAFAPAVHGLLEIDGVFLAAWVETHKGTPNPNTGGGSGAWSVVRLARVDGAGALLGPAAALRAPADSIDEVEPSLVRFGDAVAVLWGRGNHIYLCGGCVPDHRVDLLLVDPTDLTPLSQVVSITNGGGVKAGGILRRQLAVLGKSLLMSYRLTFHVHNTPGSATFECDRVK